MSESKQALSGLKVLVIDDSKTIRRTAETLLSKEGCKVFTAEDGFDALVEDRRPSARHRFRGHHDAAAGRLSDLLVDQAQQDVPFHAR